ncbi:hypothetical protein C8F04DRAFT_1071913 [Mycena alexandri]|uniref:Uncharacterized protein n=1 Tax=Mycena alexandri TaxID=1745969 RepID=A0AAD6X9I8_9AGAR|nr:hypothetical protein C8F04DRAFT_1071913 [Mycena alexandri]
MTSIRHRVGFQAAGDDDRDGQPVVLDDVEQEEVIEDLRQSNRQTTARALLLLDVVLAFSALLQLVYLLKDSKTSPLLALFPTAAPEPNLPFPTAFALLALALHANLALHLHPTLLSRSPLPIPYSLSYPLAAIDPTLNVFLRHSWQAVAWAAVPAAVVGLTHSVHSTLQEGDEALVQLETLKYRAPGP